MGYTIAIAGKGGTGKTTIAALIVRMLKEANKGSILAVDADPNSNLGEALGVQIKETIGSMIDNISKHPESISAGMSKDRFIEYQIQSIISEAEGFDVLAMGKPEGPGCYCYVNNVLRNLMGKLIKDYDYIVIDNEAGLEHLSRRTTRSADALIVVSDATAVGLKSAKRISSLVQELEIKTKNKFLLINLCNNNIEKDLQVLGLEYIGSIPEDEGINKISHNGSSLMDLSNDALALAALKKIRHPIIRKITGMSDYNDYPALK